VRVCGNQFRLRVVWLEDDRAIDDMTDCTPTGLTHHDAVCYWIDSLGGDVPAFVILQDAGFIDDADVYEVIPAA